MSVFRHSAPLDARRCGRTARAAWRIASEPPVCVAEARAARVRAWRGGGRRPSSAGNLHFIQSSANGRTDAGCARAAARQMCKSVSRAVISALSCIVTPKRQGVTEPDTRKRSRSARERSHAKPVTHRHKCTLGGQRPGPNSPGSLQLYPRCSRRPRHGLSERSMPGSCSPHFKAPSSAADAAGQR